MTKFELPSTTSVARVAVLGTGVIGAAVARNLHTASFDVTVWNRSVGKSMPLAKHGINIADSAATAVQDADVIITVLKDGESVREVVSSAAAHLRAGTLWLQLSTVGVQSIKALQVLAAEQGLVLYDAPFQGSRVPAEKAQLVVLGSGPSEHRDVLAPVLAAISNRVVWVSEEIGAASTLKLALNSLVLALTHGIAESFALARNLQIDPALIVEVISGGPLDNGHFQAKAGAILSGQFEANFSTENALKDTELVLAAARSAGLGLAVADAGAQVLRSAVGQGHGDKDFSSIYLALQA